MRKMKLGFLLLIGPTAYVIPGLVADSKFQRIFFTIKFNDTSLFVVFSFKVGYSL